MKASLNFLHQQSISWQRELKFYKDEVTLLSARLGEVVNKNTDKDVLAQVEHFQNKLIILNEQCDILKHDVNKRNEEVLEKAKDVPTHLDEKSQPVVEDLQNRMQDFTSNFAETRFAFNKFLSKVF